MEAAQVEPASSVENQTVEEPPSMKFTWTIDNFTRLNTKKHYSDVFVVGGYKWRILIFPKGNDVDHLSVYLDVADSPTLPHGWSRYAQFSLSIASQIHKKYSIRNDTQHQFNAQENDWGFTSFVPLGDLYDPSRGFLVNDTVIIKANVIVPMANTAAASSQELTGSTTQLNPTPELIGKPIATPATARISSIPEVEDIDAISVDELDVFSLQNLCSGISSSLTPSVLSLQSSFSPSEEEIELALKQIMKGLQTLSDIDELSGITTHQKADILSLAEKFETLSSHVNRVIKAKDDLARKEMLKSTLDQNLRSSVADFTVKKAEIGQVEQEIQELKDKLYVAENKKATLATETKEIYKGSLLKKKELDGLNMELTNYIENIRLRNK
ncbi:MATH domain-containing protein [Cephalotus follicularis]|uniref:MATH domain-containing protein n=1 Tax=Cephalotus follicularis TaxID=3775 RepID=A0A1Q3D131_CEPFO|nr:MATH domain-containing protein [Cephalotus follicularis]